MHHRPGDPRADDTMQRLTARIVKDQPDIAPDTARRIVGQAAAFLAASGQQPGEELSPSELVDIHTPDSPTPRSVRVPRRRPAGSCADEVGRGTPHPR
ncbi:hypothetical protein [Streptomyces sp. NPDC018833]|uniref:hypothetical protein n=1 Tax=Streptomyces sp. NPDC018833 TaxID=3365053 RepID=UPI00378EF895